MTHENARMDSMSHGQAAFFRGHPTSNVAVPGRAADRIHRVSSCGRVEMQGSVDRSLKTVNESSAVPTTPAAVARRVTRRPATLTDSPVSCAGRDAALSPFLRVVGRKICNARSSAGASIARISRGSILPAYKSRTLRSPKKPSASARARMCATGHIAKSSVSSRTTDRLQCEKISSLLREAGARTTDALLSLVLPSALREPDLEVEADRDGAVGLAVQQDGAVAPAHRLLVPDCDEELAGAASKVENEQQDGDGRRSLRENVRLSVTACQRDPNQFKIGSAYLVHRRPVGPLTVRSEDDALQILSGPDKLREHLLVQVIPLLDFGIDVLLTTASVRMGV